jgi:hypothetical protein
MVDADRPKWRAIDRNEQRMLSHRGGLWALQALSKQVIRSWVLVRYQGAGTCFARLNYLIGAPLPPEAPTPRPVWCFAALDGFSSGAMNMTYPTDPRPSLSVVGKGREADRQGRPLLARS